MLSDGTLPLIQSGVINNSRKTLHRGKIIASFVMGTQRLYDFVDDNPLVELHPNEYVNDPFVVAQNERMVAINAAIEVDLTGQVCSDSLGHLFYSGIGGQVDFIRGAVPLQGRPAHHRAAFDGRGGDHLPHRLSAEAGRGRRHEPG